METQTQPRVMLQPRKSVLRDALVRSAERQEQLAADAARWKAEVDRLAAELDSPAGTARFRLPTWRMRARMAWAILRGDTIEVQGDVIARRGVV